MYQKRKSIETMLIWTLDIVCILCSCAAAFWIRFERFYGAVSHWDQIWQISFMIFIYIMINVFVDFNHHFFRRGPSDGSNFCNLLGGAFVYPS